MNIFIIGLPCSGRTTVAKHLCSAFDFGYANATSWLKETFRSKRDDEHLQQFEDEYHSYLTNRMKTNPDIFYNNVVETVQSQPDKVCFVIDGINNPKDLSKLFDINKDIIVFLNRTDNEHEYKDYENVGISVMRDYCFWLSAAGLLPKDRWLEYNFKMLGDETDNVKALGSKNTVFIARTMNTVKSHIVGILKNLIGN